MNTAHNMRYGHDQLTQPQFDAEVARLHANHRDDRHIAFALGVHRRTVSSSRHRQGLAALYGPNGRPVEQVAA